MQINVTVTGVSKLRDKLTKLPESFFDLSIPMRAIGEWLVEDYSNMSFITRGSSVGTPWPNLKESTMREKDRLGFRATSNQPLVRTHTMQNNFHAMATPLSATVFNSTDYFKYHQSNEPRNKIPRRPMMAVTERHKALIMDLVKADVAKKMSAL